MTSSDVSSIHINESIYEKELFEKKQGQLLDWLVSIGADQKIWKKRNTEYDILKKIKQNKWILVHNTYSDYIEFEIVIIVHVQKQIYTLKIGSLIIQYLM